MVPCLQVWENWQRTAGHARDEAVIQDVVLSEQTSTHRDSYHSPPYKVSPVSDYSLSSIILFILIVI